jgi:hypothetical protein
MFTNKLDIEYKKMSQENERERITCGFFDA